jgi:hypothetical protein
VAYITASDTFASNPSLKKLLAIRECCKPKSSNKEISIIKGFTDISIIGVSI